MNITNPTSATVIPKLKGILMHDIEILQGMLRNRSEESGVFQLIDSLIYAKQSILNLFPPSDGASEIPTPNQKTRIEGYRIKNSTEIKDGFLLTGILLKIETSQLDFVKEASIGEGIPNDIKDIVKKVLEIYLKIVEQLERSKNTQQLGIIVI